MEGKTPGLTCCTCLFPWYQCSLGEGEASATESVPHEVGVHATLGGPCRKKTTLIIWTTHTGALSTDVILPQIVQSSSFSCEHLLYTTVETHSSLVCRRWYGLYIQAQLDQLVENWSLAAWLTQLTIGFCMMVRKQTVGQWGIFLLQRVHKIYFKNCLCLTPSPRYSSDKRQCKTCPMYQAHFRQFFFF